MVCGTVLTHKSPTVYNKGNRQILQANIVNHLVKSPLQKSAVDGHNRFEPFQGQPSCKSHRMLLANPYIKKTLGIQGGKLAQACALGHGSGNCHNLIVVFRQPCKRLPENSGVRRCAHSFHRFPRGHLEFAQSVEFRRIALGRFVAFAFGGHRVHQHRTFKVLGVGESLNETLQSMALDRPNVFEFQGLKKHARSKKSHE